MAGIDVPAATRRCAARLQDLGLTIRNQRLVATVESGPHAVISLSSGMTFSYDANGKLTSSTGVDVRGVSFDNLDRPITTCSAGVTHMGSVVRQPNSKPTTMPCSFNHSTTTDSGL